MIVRVYQTIAAQASRAEDDAKRKGSKREHTEHLAPRLGDPRVHATSALKMNRIEREECDCQQRALEAFRLAINEFTNHLLLTLRTTAEANMRAARDEVRDEIEAAEHAAIDDALSCVKVFDFSNENQQEEFGTNGDAHALTMARMAHAKGEVCRGLTGTTRLLYIYCGGVRIHSHRPATHTL